MARCYFYKVEGLHSTISLKQDPIKDVFLEVVQNFLYRRLILKFVGISYSFLFLLSDFYIRKKGRWRRGDINPSKNYFFIVGCGCHVVGYGFAGRGDSQSVFTTANLFLHVRLIY